MNLGKTATPDDQRKDPEGRKENIPTARLVVSSWHEVGGWGEWLTGATTSARSTPRESAAGVGPNTQSDNAIRWMTGGRWLAGRRRIA